MSVKKESGPSVEQTDSTIHKNDMQIINTPPSALNISCAERDIAIKALKKCEKSRIEDEKDKIKIIRAKCVQCHYSDHGRVIDDCIHSACALWKYRNVEFLDCIGVKKRTAGSISTADLNKGGEGV